MSMLNKVHREFRKKLDEVDSVVDCPNQGGCAIIALTHKRWVEKTYPEFKGKVKMLWLFAKDMDDAELEKLNSGKPANCYHAVLEFDGKYWDSVNTFKDLDEIQESMGVIFNHATVTVKQALNGINHRTWNTMFDREEELPKLSRIYGEKAVHGVNKQVTMKSVDSFFKDIA